MFEGASDPSMRLIRLLRVYFRASVCCVTAYLLKTSHTQNHTIRVCAPLVARVSQQAWTIND